MTVTKERTRYEDTRKVILTGVVQDPDLRYTPGGLAVFEATLAGESQGVPFFQRFKAFGKFAELIADQLVEGAAAFVVGDLSHSTWETEGGRRERLEVIARQIEAIPVGETTQSKGGKTLLPDALNQVTLVARLAETPEVRYLPQGTALVRTRVAFNDTQRGHFATLQLWGEVAEQFADQQPQKGQRVLVLGRLVGRSYTTQAGEKRYENVIEAQRVILAKGAEARTPKSEAPAEVDPFADEFPPEEDLPF